MTPKHLTGTRTTSDTVSTPVLDKGQDVQGRTPSPSCGDRGIEPSYRNSRYRRISHKETEGLFKYSVIYKTIYREKDVDLGLIRSWFRCKWSNLILTFQREGCSVIHPLNTLFNLEIISDVKRDEYTDIKVHTDGLCIIE